MTSRRQGVRIGFAAMWLVSVSVCCGRAEPAVEAKAVAGDSPYVPEGYKKGFGDEFDGPSLSLTNWWTRYIHNNGMLDTLNDEQQRFRESSNHVLTGTSVQLTARIKDLTQPRFKYESGMLRSKVTFKYGYFEARIKVPAGKGTWPGFWLAADADPTGKSPWPPEIDILEMANNIKDDKPDMFHIACQSKPPKPKPDDWVDPWGLEWIYKDKNMKGNYYHAPFNIADDFHVFAALWDHDDTVSFFIDGLRIATAKYKWVRRTGEEAPYAHVLLNLAIGGAWPGRYGVDNAALPQVLEVDYVRVYQREGKQLTGEGKIGKDLLYQ